jgi:hypothetical protein
MEKGKQYVRLMAVYGPAEAEIIKAKLESDGIRVHLKAESLRALYGIHVNGLGKVEIWVREKDIESAEALLAESLEEG